jgi:hypothetical protein
MEKYTEKIVALRFQALAVFVLLLTTGSPLSTLFASPGNVVTSADAFNQTTAPTVSQDFAIPVSFLWLFSIGVAGLILLARVIQNIRQENRVYLHHRHRPNLLDSRNK